MPYANSKIYYERVGHGDPLILLNGIMMSTSSWTYHVNKFKTSFDVITFDFRDQGKSLKMDEDYDISDRVGDLVTVMDHLKIKKANIVGVSYGAHVAEHFALSYPQRVKRLVLSNAVDKVDNYLKEVGKSWETAAQNGDTELFFRISFPLIYSRTFYNSNADWIEERIRNASKITDKNWLDGFVRLSRSGAYFDLSEKISKINMPTLLICADEDMITPKSAMKKMSEKMVKSSLIILRKTGHAAFYEKADLWCEKIQNFIKGVDT